MFFEVFINANESLIWVFMFIYTTHEFLNAEFGDVGPSVLLASIISPRTKKNIFINFLEFPIQIPCHLEEHFLSVCPLLFFLPSYNDGTFNTIYFPSLRSQGQVISKGATGHTVTPGFCSTDYSHSLLPPSWECFTNVSSTSFS